MAPEMTLGGCRSKPLASYLKALAILRLVAEQEDKQVKGYWAGESFCLSTRLSREDLAVFFCERYRPTPIVAPWNGGSGFYPADARDGITAILETEDVRFTDYQAVIKIIKSWPEMPRVLESVRAVTTTLELALSGMRPGKKRDDTVKLLEDVHSTTPPVSSVAEKGPLEIRLSELERASQKKGVDKEAYREWWQAVKKARTECTRIERGGSKELILTLCRSRLPDICLQWLDAICALHSDGRVSFSPMLGTGGNEGRLDFSNNFMQQVSELLLNTANDRSIELVQSALFGTPIPGLVPGKIGQYDPGRAGGFNQGMEVETKDFKVNPWDYVLTMEGALIFSSAVVRRNEVRGASQLASPFTVDFSPVGFTSSEYTEAGRKETWLPLWHRPATLAEVRYLFSEGRSLIGAKQARTGLDFSRAIGTLGVDRGIEAFERYAFLERRGKSYVALPAGRHHVRYRPSLDILNELDRVTTPLDRFLREFKNVPAVFLSARRQIDGTLFSCSNEPVPFRFAEVVCSLGRMERLVALRDRSKKPALQKPLLGLSPQWVLLSDDGTPEVRLAAAIASIHQTGKVGSIRANMAGVDPALPWQWASGSAQHVWLGSNLPERLGQVFSRRLLDAERFSAPRTPLEAHLRLAPEDVMAFILAQTDDSRIEDLLWGFSLIDWRKGGLRKIASTWMEPLSRHPLSRVYALLKLLHTPFDIRGIVIRKELRVGHLLQARRTIEACRVAIHRLRVSGLNPFDVFYEEPIQPERLLAALLIPVSQQWKFESLALEKKSEVS